MKKKIIIIAIVAALLYLLYKRGTFDSLLNKDDESDLSSITSGTNLNSSSLYKDYKENLESYVNRLDLNVTIGDFTLMSLLKNLTKYQTEVAVKNKMKEWVRLVWLSAKNNDQWTQTGVQSQANSNGVTYDQQIVMDAIWQMGNSEIIPTIPAGSSSFNSNYPGMIKTGFNGLINQVKNM